MKSRMQGLTDRSVTMSTFPPGRSSRSCLAAMSHPLGVAPLRQRPWNNDPVVAGENAGDPALVPLRRQFEARSGIITDILFGSGSAGLGKLGSFSARDQEIEVPDEVMKGLNMEKPEFHGEWNYRILPRPNRPCCFRALAYGFHRTAFCSRQPQDSKSSETG
jgi:hypothetical protein